LRPAGRGLEVEYEKGVVQDVRAGTAQLGIVGVRVWDTIGVESFRGLLAPFLVDSFELEREVLTSPIAGRMLAGVEKAGVVGIALHAGPLRRPFGFTGPLASRRDYRGARIGIIPGAVAQATFRALGASGRGYVPGAVSGFDGAEVDPATMVFNGWDRNAGVVTANVVLWPKPFSIVMNRKVFAGLTTEQKDILRNAGRASFGAELRQTEHDAAAAVAAACRRGRLSFRSASPSELASLRAAVQPVYAELERDSLTREVIRVIRDLRRAGQATSPTLPACGPARSGQRAAAAELLEGRWRVHWTREELIEAGLPERMLPPDAPKSAWVTVEFDRGRYRAVADGIGLVATGRYTVDGDVMSLVYDAPAPAGYVAGYAYRQRWNIFRKSLRFSRIPAADVDFVLIVNPLQRVE
jgi:TRAP-type C4-dicarboxylate transport system substrate-binding protein